MPSSVASIVRGAIASARKRAPCEFLASCVDTGDWLLGRLRLGTHRSEERMKSSTAVSRDAGRELDGLIEKVVFGRCDHHMQYVPDEELNSRCRREIMAEWQAQY